MTNYEYIKELTLEETAELLEDLDYYFKGPAEGQTWEDWLKDEAEIPIKNCPFCGKTEVESVGVYKSDEIDDYIDTDTKSYAVCCNARLGGCGAVGGYAESKSDAIKKWNQRS